MRHGGAHRLWLTASGALLFVVVAAVFLGRHYAVPRLPRLLLYALAFTESLVLVPTVLLSFQRMAGLASAGALRAALLGACIGLLCGYAIVVFGLGVW